MIWRPLRISAISHVGNALNIHWGWKESRIRAMDSVLDLPVSRPSVCTRNIPRRYFPRIIRTSWIAALTTHREARNSSCDSQQIPMGSASCLTRRLENRPNGAPIRGSPYVLNFPSRGGGACALSLFRLGRQTRAQDLPQIAQR